MAKTNFYFASIDFPQHTLDEFGQEDTEETTEELRNRLFNYVDRSEIIYSPVGEEAVWRFGRCEIRSGVILGRLGKNFTEEQTQWDEDKEDYVQEREEVEVADVSHFIIFPEFPAIAFNRKLHIGPNQFCEAFEEGYKETELPGIIELDYLREGGEYDYREFTEYADKILELEFELVPTNPYPHDDMEILDDHIRAMDAEEFEIGAESDDEESLNPDEDLLRSAGAMADGDYGEFEATYEDEDGEEKEYNSRGNPATQTTKEPDTVGGLIQHIDRFKTHIQSHINNNTDSDSDTDE